MTVDEATKFFQDNCYYEEKPARSEAMRGTFDPGYLNYTLGKLQILKLRDDYKAQEGENFSCKNFTTKCSITACRPSVSSARSCSRTKRNGTKCCDIGIVELLVCVGTAQQVFQQRLRIRRQLFHVAQLFRERARTNIDIFHFSRRLIELLFHGR